VPAVLDLNVGPRDEAVYINIWRKELRMPSSILYKQPFLYFVNMKRCFCQKYKNNILNSSSIHGQSIYIHFCRQKFVRLNKEQCRLIRRYGLGLHWLQQSLMLNRLLLVIVHRLLKYWYSF
jgi:hypothetical protein